MVFISINFWCSTHKKSLHVIIVLPYLLTNKMQIVNIFLIDHIFLAYQNTTIIIVGPIEHATLKQYL